MAKVHLNGKDWELRYTIRDGIELRKRLGRPGIKLMADIAGAEGGEQTLGFDIEALLVSIAVGIRHIRAVNEDTLAKWIQAHVDNNGKLGDLINPVIESMLEGGCWGYKKQAVIEAEAAESDAGKAEPPPETEPT